MKFKQAYREMTKGKKIKRPGWGGYWFIEDGKVKIKSKTSEILENNFNEEDITNALADDWEVVEEKKKWWEPKVNEQYFYIRSTGIVDCNNCDNDKVDKLFQSFGNCFQTVKEAEFMAEKLRVLHELEKFAYENNEEDAVMVFTHLLKAKYFFRMEIKSKKIQVVSSPTQEYLPFNIYFDSEEIAMKAIETIGEDRIKKYYFGVKEEE